MSQVAPVLLTNASLIDATEDTARAGFSLLVENGVIGEVSDGPIQSASARRNEGGQFSKNELDI